jgi:osmoprotectant transport system substrate-binding protein
LLAPLLVVAAAACGGDDDDADNAATTVAGAETTAAAGSTPTSGGGGGTVVVGSADFPESQLLAQIYGQALAEAGFTVEYQMAIGSREVYFQAIENGEVDLVPEYTNSLLSFVVRRDDPDALPEATTIDEQVTELGTVLPEGLEVLPPSTAEDKDVIACTQEAADEHQLTDLSSLAAASADIVIAGPPEFETRSPFGLAGFEQLYDAQFKEFTPLQVSAVADALAAGQVDCGNLFSTMSIITTGGFVTLEDDKGTVPAEAVLPLVRTDVVDEQLSSTLDNVNRQLTTDVLKELMVEVEVDAAAPDVVAKDWLASLQ